MYNGIKNVWKVEGLVNTRQMVSIRARLVTPDKIHLKMGNLLAHYLGEEFIMKAYNRNVSIGLSDPETRDSFYIEVGNWYRNNWYRNKNGKHIAFYFWNHGGLRSFEREGGKIVKNITRPEDKRKLRENKFVIFERDDRELEEGVLFDQGIELGSKPLYMVPYIQNDMTFEEGGRIPIYLKESPRMDLWDKANMILEKNGIRPIKYLDLGDLDKPRMEYFRSKKEFDLLKYDEEVVQGESPRHNGLYRYTVRMHLIK